MADKAQPPQPRPQRPNAGGYAPRPPKETVDERRARQSATALAAQVDLKRQAAERRASKDKTS
ncbi:MAG TPA: hypothetical protein VNA28_05050 [Solirubrobacteraceae bacterium]|nr:hypothetical protein [Solirubrobacteraceae bacterium]